MFFRRLLHARPLAASARSFARPVAVATCCLAVASGGLAYSGHPALLIARDAPQPPVEEPGEGKPERKPASMQRDASSFYIPTAHESSVLLFSGNSNLLLASEVAVLLGVQLGRATVSRFQDGEVSIQLLDNVRGKDTYVIQSMAPPVNESLLELIFLVTTLRRASAGKITAVIPYMAYTRHAREGGDVTPIAVADVARMLTVAGVDRVFVVDVHHTQVNGFFERTPVDDLDVAGIAVPYFLKKHLTAPVIVAPDHDGVQRAKRFRDLLLQHGLKDVSLAIVVDQRRRADKQDVGVDDALFDANFELVGDVQGKDCIIRDDIIESGRRVEYAAEKLRRAGASRVFAFCTHAVLSKEAYNRIERSSVVEVVCTNTLPLKQQAAKIQPLSVAALLAETIRRVHVKQSVSELFSPGGGAKSA